MSDIHRRRTFPSEGSRFIEQARAHPMISVVAAAVLLGMPAYAAFSDTFLEDTESTPSNLRVDLEPVDEGIVSYVVPAEAPWYSLPLVAGASCTPAQREWLSEHGAERRTAWKLSMLNTASGDANTLSVSDFRLEGESFAAHPPSTVSVLVDCPSAGLADWFNLTLDMADPRKAGTATSSTNQDPRPLVINLAPGERSEGQVTLDSSSGFRGVIAMDAGASEEPVRTEEIRVASSTGVLVRVIPFIDADSLQCEPVTDGGSSSTFYPCDDQAIREAAARTAQP